MRPASGRGGPAGRGGRAHDPFGPEGSCARLLVTVAVAHSVCREPVEKTCLCVSAMAKPSPASSARLKHEHPQPVIRSSFIGWPYHALSKFVAGSAAPCVSGPLTCRPSHMLAYVCQNWHRCRLRVRVRSKGLDSRNRRNPQTFAKQGARPQNHVRPEPER